MTMIKGELTQTKNKVVLCAPPPTTSARSTQESPGLPTDVLQRRARLIEGGETENKYTTPKSTTIKPQQPIFQDCEASSSSSPAGKIGVTNLRNAKVVNIVRDKCKNRELVSCLGTHMVSAVMNAYRESLQRDLRLACCRLQYCQERQEISACQMCFQQDAVPKQKPSSPRQAVLLKALTNISCQDGQYKHISCSDLNLLAFNILAGPTTAMEWSEAINLLSKCYPGYDAEMMWLFQDMMSNMSSPDTQMLRDLLNATLVAQVANHHAGLNQTIAMARMAAMTNNGGVTSQAIQVWHMTPRSVAGIVIVVVLISASLFLGFWAVYQKIRYHFFPDNTVHYSQIYMQDDYPEEEEDDFDENDVYYR